MIELDQTRDARRLRILLLIAAILLLGLWVAWAFVVPLVWAAILAVTEWPLYRRVLVRWPRHPALIASGFAVATALIILVPLSIAGVSLAQESQSALDWLKQAQQSGIPVPAWLPALPLFGPRLAEYWQQHVGSSQAANTLLGSLNASSILGWTRSIGGEVAREFGLFLVTMIALVAFLSRGRHMAERLQNLALHAFGKTGEEFLERMIVAVRGTVSGTAIVSFGEGAIIGVGYVVAGVPKPLLLTAFTVLLALVPFGAWAAFGLASLILLGTGHALAAGMLFAFGATVMTIGDNVVQPTVIGNTVELPFLLSLIGAFGGLTSFGLVGIFIGPVVMAALLLAWREWLPSGDGRSPLSY